MPFNQRHSAQFLHTNSELSAAVTDDLDISYELEPSKRSKRHTLDKAPLSKNTSLQKRSGIARVVEEFHSFTCTSTRLSTNGINHTVTFPAEAGRRLPRPEGWKGELA